MIFESMKNGWEDKKMLEDLLGYPDVDDEES